MIMVITVIGYGDNGYYCDKDNGYYCDKGYYGDRGTNGGEVFTIIRLLGLLFCRVITVIMIARVIRVIWVMKVRVIIL